MKFTEISAGGAEAVRGTELDQDAKVPKGRVGGA